MEPIIVYRVEHNGTFLCSQAQADTLQSLEVCRKGGIASVQGYKPSSGYTVTPTVNYTILTRFSTERLYRRKLDALNALTLATVRKASLSDPVLAAMDDATFAEAFQERMAFERDSMLKTLEGDRSDALRQAHDRCYYTVSQGIRVHYLTETVGTGKDKHKEPVIINGYPVADSIMLNALILGTVTVTEGQRKTVNSGVPVRISNVINKLLNSRSVSFKSLSLKPDNFSSIRVDGTTIVPDDVKPLLEVSAHSDALRFTQWLDALA